MRLHQLLIATAVLVSSSACIASQVPLEVSAPGSAEVVLRATFLGSCRSGGECDQAPAAGTRRGILVFSDADSLVMTDMKAGERVTIRPGPLVLLDVYRGQRRTAEAVLKATGKGWLEGAATGVGEVVLVAGLSKLLDLDLGGVDFGEAVKGGIVFGGAIGGLSGKNKGIQEGEAVWERVTLLQLRQQLCRCPNPDAP